MPREEFSFLCEGQGALEWVRPEIGARALESVAVPAASGELSLALERDGRGMGGVSSERGGGWRLGLGLGWGGVRGQGSGAGAWVWGGGRAGGGWGWSCGGGEYGARPHRPRKAGVRAASGSLLLSLSPSPSVPLSLSPPPPPPLLSLSLSPPPLSLSPSLFHSPFLSGGAVGSDSGRAPGQTRGSPQLRRPRRLHPMARGGSPRPASSS